MQEIRLKSSTSLKQTRLSKGKEFKVGVLIFEALPLLH